MSRAEMPPLETDLRLAVLRPLLEKNAVNKAELTLAVSATAGDTMTQPACVVASCDWYLGLLKKLSASA